MSAEESRQERFSGTMEVQERHKFDVSNLQAWMKKNVEGFSGDIEVEQFKGGQSNPSYRLNAGGKKYVLRRKPPGKLLPSAHQVDREYRVITALNQTDVPVPKTYALCQDPDVIGTDFYIMDYVEGRIFWELDLPDQTPEERRALYDGMNDALARLHNVDYEKVGLGDYGKPGSYVARQISRWSRQYQASQGPEVEEMDRLIEWLPAHLPDSDETTIVHGDYRMDNMIFHPEEPRVTAILDWEISTLGDPLADLSYHVMMWRLPASQRGLSELDFKAHGIPTEEEYVAAYCRRTGRDGIANWDFYMAYNLFRVAAIMRGVASRGLDGSAANPHALESEKGVRPAAELAWSIVQDIERRK
jgi:aminoglycoside phosphotransferase (APT) family kinase protein